MKFVVSTHQGNLYNEEVDYVTIHSHIDGEYTVMTDHIPVISVMDEGYIKLVRGNDEFFVAITTGIFEFHDNFATVLCQEAHIGRTVESAKKAIEEIRKDRLEKNRKEQGDFTIKEKEIRDNLKKSKAGSL